MVTLAINLLWILFGVVCLAGVIWLVLYGIKTFVYPIPGRLEQGIWFLFLILIIIAILSLFATGGTGALLHPFRLGSIASLAYPA